jgi:endonuclease/exonuclease/phosphatase family metal-dependent hydrolase
LRPPSVPLVSIDPFFSVWSPADKLSDAPTEHWSGQAQPMTALLRVDGRAYRLMGAEPADVPALPQTACTVLPLRTICRFADAAVEAELTFATPLMTDNLDVFSRPVTYVALRVKALDGQAHAVQFYYDVGGEIAVGDDTQRVVWQAEPVPGLAAMRLGREQQPVLGHSGDRIRVDWGWFWLAAPAGGVTLRAAAGVEARKGFAESGKLTESAPQMPAGVKAGRPVLALVRDLGSVHEAETHLLLAYDDVDSVMFFNRPLKAWWRRNGLSFADMLKSAESDTAALTARMTAFDDGLMKDLRRVGGESYAALAALAYRQSFAACKLVADPNGQPLYFSKENASNGCMGTVDVFYPQLPLLALMSPTLTRATLAPILLYASDSRWRFDFAPHDIGQYPLGNGQVYGEGERGEKNQMPVEECGNLLICLGALSQAENSAAFAAQWWPTVTRWAEYLGKKGFDPENQLCTDDFAGHLAHNANLSIKAIMGLACYAKMAAMNGDAATAERFTGLAKSMVPKWMEAAKGGRGGSYRLAFDQADTWSMKYNLVWDRALGFNLFPPDVATAEMAFYRTAQQKYGLPLDSRKLWTKSDWLVWTATLTGKRDDFEALVAPLYAFLDETPGRIPFGDWYETDSAKFLHFRGRSVVGGVYMPFLYDAALWHTYAARDAFKTGLYAPLGGKPEAGQVPVPDAQSFRMATYNIRCPIDKAPNAWTCRVERVRGMIRGHGFDGVGLQEATSNQVDDLLTDGWAYVGAGRDDGKRGGEASCIFYRKERFELRDSGTFWLSETPDVPGSKSWGTACTRVCTWAKLSDRTTGREFVWFNTHLDHMSSLARENGMELILQRMKRIAQGRAVFLTGDMNATPETEPLRRARTVLRDSADLSLTPHAGPVKTFNGFKFGREPSGQIDYILISGGIRVLNHATLNDSKERLYPSDHFPVTAEVVVE